MFSSGDLARPLDRDLALIAGKNKPLLAGNNNFSQGLDESRNQ
jgi:hypothetical protein